MNLRTYFWTALSLCFFPLGAQNSTEPTATGKWENGKAVPAEWNSVTNDYLHTPGVTGNIVHFVSDREEFNPGYISVLGCGKFKKPYSILRYDGTRTVPVREAGTERWAGPPVYNSTGDWMAVPTWSERCVDGVAGIELLVFQQTVAKKADLDYLNQRWNLVRSVGQPQFKTAWHPAFHPTKPLLFFDAEGKNGSTLIYSIPLAAGEPAPVPLSLPGEGDAVYPTFHKDLLFYSKPVAPNNLDLFQWDGTSATPMTELNSSNNDFQWTVVTADSAWLNRRTVENGTDVFVFVQSKKQLTAPKTLDPKEAPLAALLETNSSNQTTKAQENKNTTPLIPLKPATSAPERTDEFWIAAGVFEDADNAQKRAEQLATDPSLAKQISVRYDGRRYFVWVSGGDDQAKAQKLLSSVVRKAPDARLQTIPAPSNKRQQLELYFDFNQSIIRPGEAARINAFVTQLNGTPGTFELIGHCDSRGSNAYNLQLGLRRAQSTRAFLTQLMGAVSSKESSRSEWDLQAPCPDGIPCDETAHERNRRVVLVFTPQ